MHGKDEPLKDEPVLNSAAVKKSASNEKGVAGKKRVAVLVSGGGTNLKALLEAEKDGLIPHGQIALVISSKASAKAVQIAQKSCVETIILEDKKERSEKLAEVLIENKIDLVVLAGFLPLIDEEKTLSVYKNRIINIHPSLLPAFGGKGCYGLYVHQLALEAGVKISGATVHFVDGTIDGGRIFLQKAVEVFDDDSAESLQRRVMEEAEWILLPRAVELICKALFGIEK